MIADTQAADWYDKAAKQGDLRAMYNLGLMYHEGLGVQQNYQKSIDLFLRIADEGRYEEDGSLHYKALYMLGNIYRDGQGVPQNYVEAYKWYFMAAARGDPDATAQMEAVAHFMSADQISDARNAATAFAKSGKTHP